MELNDLFSETSAAVDAELEAIVDEFAREPEKLRAAMKWSLLGGGKRFRPALTFAVGRVFDAPREALLRSAAAIEMIHTYSLIHDDLPSMDDDELRRGRATCHVKFGEATAILAGDALQAIAFIAIANDDRLTSDLRLAVIAVLADAAAKMVAGQQMDLEAEGVTIDVDHLETIHRNKTGALITASAVAGALIGNASADDTAALRGFADRLGLLFQITDDLLDVTQSTEVLGKTSGKDAAADKATFPGLYGLAESGRLAESVHLEACRCLDRLSRPSVELRLIADHILNRRS